MWIKICGNTRLQDCLLAAELGADAVGFIFAHGRRLMTSERVAAITAELPPILEKIGVFTTSDYDTIVRTVEEAGLTGVQLHNGPDFTLSERLRLYFGDADRCSVIQVLPWWTDRMPVQQRAEFTAAAREIAEDGSADAMLIDSRSEAKIGGTGVALDWAAAHQALGGIDYRTIVAGGLHDGNVAEAIQATQPWGVDVSSGVEDDVPGHKNPDKLQAFCAAARNASLRSLASLDIR